MRIKILFSKNDLIGSRLISWASSPYVTDMKDIPSHTAVLLNESLVVESVMLNGVRIIPYKCWLKKNKQLDCFPLEDIAGKLDDTDPEEFKELIYELWGKGYDFKGLAYFAYCIIKNRLLGIPMPKENKWETESKFFCTEFVGRLVGYNYSMTSPAVMLAEFRKILEPK